MNKNGKFFLPPPKDGSDFKEIFKGLAAAGAGRPLSEDGFPAGPWTPEFLAEAISQIDSNTAGVDLRTVQLWFQENDKGISTTNIRWLARIFGCDDPVATNEWQVELIAAQSRLLARRREKTSDSSSLAHKHKENAITASHPVETDSASELTGKSAHQRTRQRFSLARESEALFSCGSPLNLAAWVFAGFTALGFLSYITGIHNVTYTRPDRIVKQVGFLWTANWTFVFMVFLPLFVAFVSDSMIFWRDEGRPKLLSLSDRTDNDNTWIRRVEASSSSFWAVFLICVLFAGLFQWIGVCLIPLIKGGGSYATDWGSIAMVRPEIISVPEEIIFTGFAYLYMCLCFYLFFAGLILLYSLVHDFGKIEPISGVETGNNHRREIRQTSLKVIHAIFRCTVLGVLIAIVMKVQSFYLTSRGANIVAWLFGDMASAFHGPDLVSDASRFRMPTQYSSLVVAISSCFVFAYGMVHLGTGRRLSMLNAGMIAVVTLLFASYLLIGAFSGFSILLSVAALLALYGLINPGLGLSQENDLGSEQSVS